MEQSDGSQNMKHDDGDNKPKASIGLVWDVSYTAMAIWSWLIAVALVGWWIFSHVSVEYKAQAFIESILTLAIVDVIVVHAVMYYQQAKEANKQTEVMSVALQPSLRVTQVRVEDLEAGKEPVFIVSVINDGRNDARNVSLGIKVSVGHPIEGALAKKLPINVVTMPAGQERQYFVPWETEILQEHVDAFNNKKAPLKVSGTFKIGNGEESTFCYRYYPWKGDRPDGVSQFVPCDFDTRLTTVVTPAAARLKLTAHAPQVIITESPKQPEAQETKPKNDKEKPN